MKKSWTSDAAVGNPRALLPAIIEDSNSNNNNNNNSGTHHRNNNNGNNRSTLSLDAQQKIKKSTDDYVEAPCSSHNNNNIDETSSSSSSSSSPIADSCHHHHHHHTQYRVSLPDNDDAHHPTTDNGDNNRTLSLMPEKEDTNNNESTDGGESFEPKLSTMTTAPGMTENDDSNNDDEQPVYFAETSFFCVKRGNFIRKQAVRLITWKWFERFSIFVIILNCIALGAVDPCDAEMLLKMFAMGVLGKHSYLSETWNRFDCFIVITGIIEYIFVEEDINISAIRAFRVFRPLRAITRIPSMFLLYLISLGLRLLILLLLDTMPMLGNVLLFCCLVFFIFGIAGVQLLSGILRHRCFFPLPMFSPTQIISRLSNNYNASSSPSSPPFISQPPAPAFMPPYYHRPNGDFICSPGEGVLRCSEIPFYEEQDSMCAELFGDNSQEARICRDWVRNYTDCRPDGPNPAKGALSFDHIGAAWMAIFQVISLEGWTKVMYYIQDSYSFWIWIYFVMLVVAGSFFAVNLCLVVIATQFSETKRRETSKMKMERNLTLKQSSSTLLDQGNFYTQIYDIIAQLITIVFHACFGGRCRKHHHDNNKNNNQPNNNNNKNKESGQMADVEIVLHCNVANEEDEREQSCSAASVILANEILDIANRKSDDLPQSAVAAVKSRPVSRENSGQQRQGIYCHQFIIDQIEGHRLMCRRCLEHNVAAGTIISVIVINAIFMGMEHYGQPDFLTKMFSFTDPLFSGFFAIEVLIKIYAYGFPLYIRDALNLLDLVTVIINLVEMFHGGGSKLSVLRTFRLVRVLKIVRFLPALQRQLMVMLRTIDNIATFFILLSFFLFIFALLGMSLFGCRFCPYYDDRPGNKHHRVPTTPSSYLDGGGNFVTVAEQWLIRKDGYNCLFKVLQSENDAAAVAPVSVSGESQVAVLGEDELTAEERHLLAYYTCPRANFDSLLLSLFTVLQVFTQDAWSLVLIDGIYYGSDWAGLYFVALVTFGNYVLFNLLVAILVEGFSNQGEETMSSTSGDNKVVDDPPTEIQPSPINRPSLVPPKIIVENVSGSEEEGSENQIAGGSLPLEDADNDNNSSSVTTESRRLPSAVKLQQSRYRAFAGAILNFFRHRSNHSLFLLSSSNRFRKSLLRIVLSSGFDNVILAFILANCFAIMLERPSIKRGSFERNCLDVANYVFNGLFLLEALAKITAMGFVIGPDTYLKSGWNVLDCFLVSCSTVYTSLEVFSPKTSETKILEIFRVLRLLRALRPLRVVNRAPGLKIVVETLLLSIKPIGNVIIICLTFFLIFAILGVQLFQGCFYECTIKTHHITPDNDVGISNNNASSPSALMNSSTLLSHYSPDRAQLKIYAALYNVSTKADCLSRGYEWENESYNFDNIFQALMTLFVFATFDGWVDITRDAIDCVGIDRQPIRDYNPWNVVFFISFLLIVCFFILNMFVGVVVHNFQRVQERVRAEFKAKRIQMKQERLLNRLRKRSQPKSGRSKLLVKLTKQREGTPGSSGEHAPVTVLASEQVPVVTLKPPPESEDLTFLEDYPYWRLVIYQIFTHKYFELGLAGITAANIIVMAVEYYQMPRGLLLTVRFVGYAFTGLLVLEVFAKMVAFGFWRYIKDRWNQLDVAIVVLSLGAIYLEDDNPDGPVMPVNPTIIRVARIVRIARVFKLLKTAAGIRRLLDTVGRALPQVGNLALFFLLLFFIYASLGVELFGKFQCQYGSCEGLSRHANYQNFGMALLTLFRVFTGDDWNGILKDMLRIANNKEECAALMAGGAALPEDRDFSVECTLAGVLAPFYFVSFVLFAQFVLINVVVAVLMNELEESHRRDAMERLSGHDIDDEKNMEEKVAAMEVLVKSACHVLVDELQAKLGTTREEVIGIVSTEYVLRETEAEVLSKPRLSVSSVHRHNRPLASSETMQNLMATRPVLAPRRSDSMNTIELKERQQPRSSKKLKETRRISTADEMNHHHHHHHQKSVDSSNNSNLTSKDSEAESDAVLSVDATVLEQVFRDLGHNLSPPSSDSNACEQNSSSVVDEFVQLHHRRSTSQLVKRQASLRFNNKASHRTNSTSSNNNNNNVPQNLSSITTTASIHEDFSAECSKMMADDTV